MGLKISRLEAISQKISTLEAMCLKIFRLEAVGLKISMLKSVGLKITRLEVVDFLSKYRCPAFGISILFVDTFRLMTGIIKNVIEIILQIGTS